VDENLRKEVRGRKKDERVARWKRDFPNLNDMTRTGTRNNKSPIKPILIDRFLEKRLKENESFYFWKKVFQERRNRKRLEEGSRKRRIHSEMRSILSSSTVSSLSEGRRLPTKSSVRVVSYNVLSSHLDHPSWFWTCKPEHLDATIRLEKIKMKLKAEIDQGSIICLQEVSLCWSGALHQFFAENNYHFITALYGSGFTGYMGVAIAIPLHKYHIKEVDIRRLSKTMTGSPPLPPYSALPIPAETRTTAVSWWQTISTRLQAAVTYFYPTNKNRLQLSFRREQSSSSPSSFSSSFSSYNIWEMISSKTNQMICCRLSLRGEGEGEGREKNWSWALITCPAISTAHQ
jgi:hypothetical protein